MWFFIIFRYVFWQKARGPRLSTSNVRSGGATAAVVDPKTLEVKRFLQAPGVVGVRTAWLFRVRGRCGRVPEWSLEMERMILGKADEPWSTGMCIPVFRKLEHVRTILQPSSIIQIFDINPQRKQDLVMFNREPMVWDIASSRNARVNIPRNGGVYCLLVELGYSSVHRYLMIYNTWVYAYI